MGACYTVTLKLQSADRIREAFGLKLEDIAAVVTSSVIPSLSRIMKMELKRSANYDGTSNYVLGGESSEFVYEKPSDNKIKNDDELDEDDADEGDEDGTGAEDGVAASKFGLKK